MSKYKNNRDFTQVNHQIRAAKVICIDNKNNNLGVIHTSDALKIASESNLDLVMVSNKSKIPTCKILDYGKFKYEQSKKDKAVAKKQRENATKIKEIHFRPSTGENDLKTKALKAQEMLENGNKVKISVKFKGREISHKEVGEQAMDYFMSLLDEIDFDSAPTISGKVLWTVVKKKESKSKKEGP